jgi:hypothetical protein
MDYNLFIFCYDTFLGSQFCVHVLLAFIKTNCACLKSTLGKKQLEMKDDENTN